MVTWLPHKVMWSSYSTCIQLPSSRTIPLSRLLDTAVPHTGCRQSPPFAQLEQVTQAPIYWHSIITFWSHANHILITCKSHVNHILITCKSHFDHILITFWSHANHTLLNVMHSLMLYISALPNLTPCGFRVPSLQRTQSANKDKQEQHLYSKV